MKNAFATQRRNMIDGQIKPFNVVDVRLLAAFDTVARESYVPEDKKKQAYLDADIALGEGRYLLEASVYARLLQEADIIADEAVLDVGCLMGYSSAVLDALGATVTAQDTETWISQAKKLAPKKADITFASGDLTKPVSGTFDLVILNGAVEQIPDTFKNALKDGGRIAAFIRNGTEGHAVLCRKHGDHFHQQILFDAVVPVLPGFEKAKGFSF